MVIGGDSEDLQEGFTDAAGIAPTASFLSNNTNKPNVGLAFAYRPDQTMGLHTEYEIAKTVSHEAGHVLGLRHQAEYDRGDYVDSREPGNRGFSPIMGGWQDKEVTSLGFLLNQNGGHPMRTIWWEGPAEPLIDKCKEPVFEDKRRAFTQDDMKILGAQTPADLPNIYNCMDTTLPDDYESIFGEECAPILPNGFGYKADDHGDFAYDATGMGLAEQAGNFSAWRGIIEKHSDVDYFSFVVPRPALTTQTQPMVTVDARVVVSDRFEPNLFPILELRDFTGAQMLAESRDIQGRIVSSVGGSDPIRSTSFDSSILTELLPGEYRLAVRSHGDYGDTGQYTLQVRVNAGPYIKYHRAFSDRLRVAFSQPIRNDIFMLSDVQITDGDPTSRLAATAIDPVAGLQNAYDIHFPEYSSVDGIQIRVGPRIKNLQGVDMDQNGNGSPGEMPVGTDSLDAFEFTDFSPPTVRRVLFQLGKVVIDFSEPINPNSVNLQSLNVLDANGTPFPNASPLAVTDTRFEIPMHSYPVGGIQVVFNTTIRDWFGNTLAQTERFEHRDVAGPRVEDVALAADQSLPGEGMIRGPALLIAFDEPVVSSVPVPGGPPPTSPDMAITYQGSPVEVTDISSYPGSGERLWLVSFIPLGSGMYDVRVPITNEDLFHNTMNQDDDQTNGEIFEDYFHDRFEYNVGWSINEWLDEDDAYRLVGQMIWGDGWLIHHSPEQFLSDPREEPREGESINDDPVGDQTIRTCPK